MSTYDQVTLGHGDRQTSNNPDNDKKLEARPDLPTDPDSDDTVYGGDGPPKGGKLSDGQNETQSMKEKEQQPPDDSDEQDEHGDNDEENQGGPPKPVGFLDPSLNAVRMEVFIGWLKTTLGLATFILCVLSLYWAVFFSVEENMGSLTVAVVNFDGQVAPYTQTTGLIGQTVVKAAEKQAQIRRGVIGYRIRDPAQFDNDPTAVRQWVFDEHDWAAIIINANATTLLQQAVAQGNSSYDPLGAMQLIYVEARDQDSYAEYILPQLNEFMINVQAQFGQQWVRRVLDNDNLNPRTYANAPQALSPAIGTSIFNLRPFGPPQVTPAVSIGLIYLIILSFFNFGFYLPSEYQEVHTLFC